MDSKSPKGQLDLTDLKNLGATSVRIGVAAALTYFTQNLSGVDLGEYSVIIVGVLTIVIDAVQKTLKDNTKKD
jgi:hypothetical protein